MATSRLGLWPRGTDRDARPGLGEIEALRRSATGRSARIGNDELAGDRP